MLEFGGENESMRKNDKNKRKCYTNLYNSRCKFPPSPFVNFAGRRTYAGKVRIYSYNVVIIHSYKFLGPVQLGGMKCLLSLGWSGVEDVMTFSRENVI